LRIINYNAIYYHSYSMGFKSATAMPFRPAAHALAGAEELEELEEPEEPEER
jgi:hypothetical protein